MPKYIIKLKDKKFKKDYYLEWSTIVDAPISYGFTSDQFKEYYKNQYGERGLSELDSRLERVEQTGISALDQTLDELLSFNRAGENEKSISKEQILEKYCRNV